jgi:biotin carboxyl carrier protein
MQSTDSPEPSRSAWSRYRTPIGASLAVVLGAVGIFLIAPSEDAKPNAAPSPAAPAASPTPAASPEPVATGKIGNINDVKVSNGQSIKKGDVLVILEAMKMENEIMAPRDGVVASVNVTKGATVNTGDVLLSLN